MLDKYKDAQAAMNAFLTEHVNHAQMRKPILTTTRSLLKIPAIDLNGPEQLEIDLCKLSIWRATMALKKLKEKIG